MVPHENPSGSSANINVCARAMGEVFETGKRTHRLLLTELLLQQATSMSEGNVNEVRCGAVPESKEERASEQ